MKSISAGSSWLRYHRPRPEARLRLFCFPYAGGGASIFRTWQENLPSEIEVYPIQLPGREDRFVETPFTQLSALLDPLMQALSPYLDMPYAFFGHSMGALISFELVRCLRQQGHALPVRLLVSAHRAPQLPDPDQPVHDLPEPAFLEELSRLNGTPQEVLQNAELLQLLLPLLRADFALCETYRHVHEKPLTCPISVFGGLQDNEVSRDMLTAWCDQTISMCKLRLFPGDHFFIHSTQTALLQALSTDLLQDLPSLPCP